MDKQSRLELIRDIFHRTRGQRKELPPELLDLVHELKEETVEFTQPATVVDFHDEDVWDEVQYLEGYRRQVNEAQEGDWEALRLVEDDLTPKTKHWDRYAVAN